MRSSSYLLRTTAAATCVACACALLPLRAEDVSKKFRLSLGVGFLNSQGKASSDSANVLTLIDQNFQVVNAFLDPRNDSAVFGNLELKPGAVASVAAQYALSPIWLVELSAGYQRTQLGDIDVEAQFDGVAQPQAPLDFDFRSFQIEAGDVEMAPIEASLIARFRPRARLNPYLGGGVGYTFLGFEPSDAFNQLSVNLDASQGQQYIVLNAFGPGGFQEGPQPVHDLDGAHVDLGGTWTWHGLAGIEVSFKRKWVAFLDARYSFSSRNIEVGFDGGQDLGVAVPNVTDYCAGSPGEQPLGQPNTVCPGSSAGEAARTGEFGPMRVTFGGLVDGGRIVPTNQVPAEYLNECNPDAATCFISLPDGNVDTGFYYVQGGKFSYDAFSMVIGVRYTF